ncbi:MAG: hypothetical protein K2Q12_00915, partial [Rickettsiales bacterium]|nr:hypothetical protein [Rickettsiales bacterium]
HKIKTMRPEAGGQNGPAFGKLRRIHKVVLRLYKALGGAMGPQEGQARTLEFTRIRDFVGAIPGLFAPVWPEDLEAVFTSDTDTRGNVYIEGDDPLPFTVCAIAPRFGIHDD